MHPKQKQMSPAAAEFTVAGGSQLVIAAALGVSQPQISRILSGQRCKPEGFDIALRAHIGPDAANRVIALIGRYP